jgi:hypothetical protein
VNRDLTPFVGAYGATAPRKQHPMKATHLMKATPDADPGDAIAKPQLARKRIRKHVGVS